MRAELTGIGWVTAAGLGTGRSAATFDWGAGKLPTLTGHPAFGSTATRAGRMDAYSRLGVVAIALALEDAGLTTAQDNGAVGAVASSSFGCLQTDWDYYETVLPNDGRLSSPNLFAYTLPNCFLGDAAIRFGLRGPSFVVCEASPTGLEPLRLALEMIALGECTTVVAGVCDLPPPEGIAAPGTLQPGAVFLVAGGSPSAASVPYGELELGAGGVLRFGLEPVASLSELMRVALGALRVPRS